MSLTDTVVPPQCHAVSFFRNDEQLCSEIAAFAAEGLALDQPALIVTNEAHRSGISQELEAAGVCVADAIARGDLALVDADACLKAIMPADMPDPDLYNEQVGAAVSQLLRGRPGPIRIFGDMVDLLWQRQQYDAAIRIEILSNQLAATHPILVICGYSMGHFLKTATKLELVRCLHGRVHEPAAAAERPRRARAPHVARARVGVARRRGARG